MRSILKVAALGLAMLSAPALAHAGVYTDDMAKCLVNSSSPEDQKDLVEWIFTAIGHSPDIHQYINITPAQDAAVMQKTAKLYERLLTVDCRKETVTAMKNEGASAAQEAFTVLGRVAARGLFGSAEVQAYMGNLEKYIDMNKLKEMDKEAGLGAAPADKPK